MRQRKRVSGIYMASPLSQEQSWSNGAQSWVYVSVISLLFWKLILACFTGVWWWLVPSKRKVCWFSCGGQINRGPCFENGFLCAIWFVRTW
jgi:hypothetical protein